MNDFLIHNDINASSRAMLQGIQAQLQLAESQAISPEVSPYSTLKNHIKKISNELNQFTIRYEDLPWLTEEELISEVVAYVELKQITFNESIDEHPHLLVKTVLDHMDHMPCRVSFEVCRKAIDQVFGTNNQDEYNASMNAFDIKWLLEQTLPDQFTIDSQHLSGVITISTTREILESLNHSMHCNVQHNEQSDDYDLTINDVEVNLEFNKSE